MATIPIFNPITPFLGEIPGGLHVGLMIKVKGFVVGKYGRCMIDFRNNPALTTNEDIMLHLSIRPKERVLVRNHFENKVWGPEERYGDSPIRSDETFEMIILVDTFMFKIAINGGHFQNFKHRFPIEKTRFIHVTGDCQIDHILIEQNIETPQHIFYYN